MEKKLHLHFTIDFFGKKNRFGWHSRNCSLTNKHICSIPSLVSLVNKEPGVHDGLKALAAGKVMMIAMYNQWDLYTVENQTVIEKLLQKNKQKGVAGVKFFSSCVKI